MSVKNVQVKKADNGYVPETQESDDNYSSLKRFVEHVIKHAKQNGKKRDILRRACTLIASLEPQPVKTYLGRPF